MDYVVHCTITDLCYYLPLHYLLSCICKYSSQVSHLLLCFSITDISISCASIIVALIDNFDSNLRSSPCNKTIFIKFRYQIIYFYFLLCLNYYYSSLFFFFFNNPSFNFSYLCIISTNSILHLITIYLIINLYP